MKQLIVYSIPNCDVTKLALARLRKNKIDFSFHDYKKSGITISKLNDWSKKVGWEKLLNKRGTTWRGISTDIQQTINDQRSAVHLMQEHTSLIKRPVIEMNGEILIGFDEAIYNDKILNG